MGEREPVTTETCKLITEALKDKVEAQKALIDAEIKSVSDQMGNLKITVVACFTTATAILSILSFLLKLWRP